MENINLPEFDALIYYIQTNHLSQWMTQSKTSLMVSMLIPSRI